MATADAGSAALGAEAAAETESGGGKAAGAAQAAGEALPAAAGAVEARADAGWAACVVATLAFVFLVLHAMPSVGWPLLLATIGAYLFHPVVCALERRGLSRTAATGALFGAGLAATALGAVFLVPMLVSQARKLPEYLVWTAGKTLPVAEQVLGRPLPGDLRELAEFVNAHLDQILSRALPSAGSVVGMLVGGSLSVLSSVLGALVVPVVGFFLLRGWPAVLEGAESLVPPGQRPFVRARTAEVDRILGGFVRGQLTMAAVLSVLYSTALSLIGLKLAIVVGLVTGFGNLVPYVGIGTGLALGMGFCLVDFGFDYHLALVFSTFALLLAADGMFITPRVVGNRVGLSPAAVIVAVLACGSLFGFAGVLLAVPSAAVLKLVARTLVGCWRQTALYRGV